MLLSTLLVATTLGTATPLPTMAPDTFEVMLAQHGGPFPGRQVLRIEADDLDFVQWNMVVLRREGASVAVFQSHQVLVAINRTAGGERTYELIPQQGAPVEFRADRMVPFQNNMVLFYTGDRIVGLATQNGAAVVLDKSARVGPA